MSVNPKFECDIGGTGGTSGTGCIGGTGKKGYRLYVKGSTPKYETTAYRAYITFDVRLKC